MLASCIWSNASLVVSSTELTAGYKNDQHLVPFKEKTDILYEFMSLL